MDLDQAHHLFMCELLRYSKHDRMGPPYAQLYMLDFTFIFVFLITMVVMEVLDLHDVPPQSQKPLIFYKK